METKTIGGLLAKLRKAQDSKDELNAALNLINKEIGDVERDLLDVMKESGQVKAADNFISVSLGQKWRATYDPAKWPGIVKWAVETGNDHIIQRRMTDTKVMELVDTGVELPDGLGVESFPDLSFRRISAAAR
jgi:hypothetical protein